MGQKTNPIGLRIAVNRDWRSKWFAGKKEFGRLLTRRPQHSRPAEEEARISFSPEDSDRARGESVPNHHSDRASGDCDWAQRRRD
jgi:hypothetical protein